MAEYKQNVKSGQIKTETYVKQKVVDKTAPEFQGRIEETYKASVSLDIGTESVKISSATNPITGKVDIKTSYKLHNTTLGRLQALGNLLYKVASKELTAIVKGTEGVVKYQGLSQVDIAQAQTAAETYQKEADVYNTSKKAPKKQKIKTTIATTSPTGLVFSNETLEDKL